MGMGKASGAALRRVELRAPRSRSVVGIVLEERRVEECGLDVFFTSSRP